MVMVTILGGFVLVSDCLDLSVIVTSRKRCVETLVSCPDVSDVVVCRDFGLGLARNNGARKAKRELLVFLDDDLVVDPELWKHVLEVKSGEFGMMIIGQ